MDVLYTFSSFVGRSSKRQGRSKATRQGNSRSLRFEGLESRQMLSITPGDFPVGSEDILTANGLAIDPTDGPEAPPFPSGLEGQIQSTLWRVVAAVEDAVDSGDLQIVPASTESADVDLSNTAVANIRQNGTIHVFATMNTFESTTLEAIVGLGAEIVSANEFAGLVEIWAPFDKVDELAALESVDFVELPIYPVLQAGLVDSDGDGILNADDVRTHIGVDGTGIRIGVISDGVDHRSSVQGGANPDLPTITVNSARPGSGDEGTAMLEIIHDLAPGADLFFSSGIQGTLAMIDSVNWLVSPGRRRDCGRPRFLWAALLFRRCDRTGGPNGY